MHVQVGGMRALVNINLYKIHICNILSSQILNRCTEVEVVVTKIDNFTKLLEIDFKLDTTIDTCIRLTKQM